MTPAAIRNPGRHFIPKLPDRSPASSQTAVTVVNQIANEVGIIYATNHVNGVPNITF